MLATLFTYSDSFVKTSLKRTHKKPISFMYTVPKHRPQTSRSQCNSQSITLLEDVSGNRSVPRCYRERAH